jgi:putative membrane protein insertion efficiency factor
MRTLILFLIRIYQWCISPFTGPSCRFYPSCSCYAHTAVMRFGAWRGSKLAAQRLLKCHPWNPGGYDPVPDLTPPNSITHSPTSTDHSGHTLHG